MSIADTFARMVGPGVVGGMLCKWLENSSPADVYTMAIQHQGKNAWEFLPVEWKEKLKNYNSKYQILEQLNLDWAVQELYKGNRSDLASLVVNTPEVASFVEKIIADLQEGASDAES